MNDSNALISVKNAAFGYGGVVIIDHVSLDVCDGEFIGLIGPNGAGKSTLFKGLLRLIAPMSGTVDHSPRIHKKIGYVPQRDQLDAIYPLTAFDVAAMGPAAAAAWYRFPGSSTRKRVMDCLARVDMQDQKDKPFSALSGGQRQRVLIARALAMNPEMLVLDEPTAGIDPVAEESVLKLLGELNTQQKITILMVSHHIHSLRGRVHRAVLVKDRAVICGSSEEMLNPDRIMELLD
ncbi:MAG: metal ABC transporter ATP-binding protein [Elusimicrobia bacterium]|nr:metal ABC transporter ATP-binding protein [Elusimicrobiota bacterium]